MTNKFKHYLKMTVLGGACLFMFGCADANVPGPRDVNIPAPGQPTDRQEAVNEGPDAVTRIAIGDDILVPKRRSSESLPVDIVGPFELRGETLGGALQLIMANYEIPLAFETEEGLERRVTVSNLKGELGTVVRRVCALADLYCSYEDETLIIKDTETFTVALPPLGEDVDFEDIATGLEAITGVAPTLDNTTRTIIYTATHRNAQKAEQYFDRLRANTALVVYETYIWEVQLNGTNSAGIRWEQFGDLGNFNSGINLSGTLSNQVGTPISIGLPTKGPVNFAVSDVVQFISEQGAIKTISQPQLTVLSGSEATLRVAETINYVESLTRSFDDNNNETVSTQTGTVDTGFTLTIASSWDNSTVYGDIEIDLEEFLGFQTFDAGSSDTIQLPRTSERSLETQVRVRPGDSILIAGLVRETDEYDTAGAGFMSPIIPTDRTVETGNTELVFLLRPRVIMYQSEDEINVDDGIFTINNNLTTDLPMGTLSSDMLNPSLSVMTETME